MPVSMSAAWILALLAVAGLQAADARVGCVPTSKHRPPSPKAHHRPPPPATPRTMTIFGDSWSDDGSNEFPVTNGTVPNPELYTNGRNCNGPVWGEYMVNQSKGSIASVENYAYVGAYACATTQKIFGPTPVAWKPLELALQVSKYLAAKARRNNTSTIPNVVVIVGAGYNDFLGAGISQIVPVDGMAFLNNSEAQNAVRRTGVISCITASLQTLAAAGETNIVMSNIPVSRYTPLLSPFNPVQLAAARAVTVAFNLELGKAITTLQAMLPNTKLHYLDTRGILDTLFEDAVAKGVNSNSCITTSPPNIGTLYGSLYAGIPMNTTECPSKGPGYFWFDHEHPTTVYHAAMGAAFTKQFHAWGLY